MLLIGGLVGGAPAMAQTSDPHVSLDIPSQEVEMRRSDEAIQTVHIKGRFDGQRDGTASGSMTITVLGVDGSQRVFRYYATKWDDLTFNEKGDFTRVRFSVETTGDDGATDTPDGSSHLDIEINQAYIDLELATVIQSVAWWLDVEGELCVTNGKLICTMRPIIVTGS